MQLSDTNDLKAEEKESVPEEEEEAEALGGLFEEDTLKNPLTSLVRRASAGESEEAAAADEGEDNWFRVWKVNAWCSCITNPDSSENERGEALAFLHLAMAAAKVGGDTLLSSAVTILKQKVGSPKEIIPIG